MLTRLEMQEKISVSRIMFLAGQGFENLNRFYYENV